MAGLIEEWCLLTVVALCHAWYQGEMRTFPFASRLGAFRPRDSSYWAGRTSSQLRHSRHMRGFVPQDGGSPSQIETHGDLPRIKEIFDDSGSSIILSRMGFQIRLKSKK